MHPKKKKIDSDQNGVDIGLKILNDIALGLVDQEDKDGRGEVIQKSSNAF
jgi:hypothetical protein